MTSQLWVLVAVVIFAELAVAGFPGPETFFTGVSETELRQQLGPVDRMHTFALSDPLPEERVEILNFLEPDWDDETGETIKEMIWEQGQERLVIWLLQQDDGNWRAFHHNVVLPEVGGPDSADCGRYR
ncbi:MAG: hypothetical protein AAFP10_07260 [Pseudomonadota bacterium]